MALDFRELVAPKHTAIVTHDCQGGLIGPGSALPELADAVSRGGMIRHVARLVSAARQAGARIVHCLDVRRADRRGASRNAALFRFLEKQPGTLLAGTPSGALVDEISCEPTDVVLMRHHGLSAFHASELDSLLRADGVRTVVGVGVSINIGVTNLAFDAVNHGYQMVIPRDAVAGYPDQHVEMMFAHSLRGIATLTTSAELIAAWNGRRNDAVHSS